MPAYSYTSGDPIGITALNPTTGQFIEVTYAASGLSYSYSRVAWLPDIPIDDQIKVFTRPNSTGLETAMIEGTDFTFGPSETVVFTNAPVGQVVIRRSTDLSKMILSYVDGAKFTSRQLNSTMHQLLFIAQEKANFGTNIFNYYPVSVVADTWSNATNYVVNDVVIHSGGIYVCIANNSNNNPSSSPLFWAFQNPQSNGFYVTGYGAPVNLHMGSIEDGQTWVWSAAQKRFQSGFAINSSANLSDYLISLPANNQILEYSSNRWRNKTVQWTPTLTGPNLILSKHIFNSVLTSFADNDISLPSLSIGF
jgi:Phage T7 tail fibre protein./Carbohydrate binding domain.